jgi:hypothetical protein
MKTIAVTTPGTLALTMGTFASNAPGFSGTASTTGSNSVTAVNLGGVTGSSNSITFEAGTFATGSTITAAVGGSTFVLGTESAADAITFTGGAGVDSFTTGTTGTFTVNLGGGATNVFNGAAMVAATSGNTANVTGGDGADTVTTGPNADVISTGAGNDVINAGMGADVINGGLGADAYTFGLGAAAVAVGAETQIITATLGGTPVTAGTFVINILGTSVNVAIDTSPTADEYTAAATAALNSIAAGRFLAVNTGTGVVTITYATSLGNVAPATTNVFNGTASDAAVIGATTNIFTTTVTTTVAGTTAVAAQSSDSILTAFDQLTYVSGTDTIALTTRAGAAVNAVAATATAASAGNYGAIAAGLYTPLAGETTLDGIITGVAANITAGTTAAGESAVFVFQGQAYLYVSDAVNGYAAAGDLVIQLTGITTLANGLTAAGGLITAIS